MRMGMRGRFQKRHGLSILAILFFLSLGSWNAAHSQEPVTVPGGKGHPKIESALLDLQQEYLIYGNGSSRPLRGDGAFNR